MGRGPRNGPTKSFLVPLKRPPVGRPPRREAPASKRPAAPSRGRQAEWTCLAGRRRTGIGAAPTPRPEAPLAALVCAPVLTEARAVRPTRRGVRAAPMGAQKRTEWPASRDPTPARVASCQRKRALALPPAAASTAGPGRGGGGAVATASSGEGRPVAAAERGAVGLGAPF